MPEEIVHNQTHTYPDGSARVGMPPFPEMSPLEEAAANQEAAFAEEPVKVSGTLTANDLAGKTKKK